jgi:hypothetical protein
VKLKFAERPIKPVTENEAEPTKWIFSIEVAKDKSLISFNRNSHAKMAPDGLTRRRAGGEAETLGIVARHRHLHHLGRAAGKSERHAHQRAGARPGDQFIGGGNGKPLSASSLLRVRNEGSSAPIGRLVDRPVFGRRVSWPT